MACTITYTGFSNGILQIMPGQTITNNVAVTVNNSCSACSHNITAISVSSSVSWLTVSVVSGTPALPVTTPYCGTPFNVGLTCVSSSGAPTSTGGLITVTFKFAGGGADMSFTIPVMSVALGIPQSVNIGDWCPHDTYDLILCNNSSAYTNITIAGCSCPNISLSASSASIGACDCTAITLTLSGTGQYGVAQSCTLMVIDDSGTVTPITLFWTEIYCPITITGWSVDDPNSLVTYSSEDYSADCHVMTVGAIGETVTVTIDATVSDALAVGDDIYFSAWMFAQLVDWKFYTPGAPVAGWRYRVCDTGEGVDGTFDMEWYGEQFSNENSVTDPYMSVAIGTSGTTLKFILKCVLMADAQTEAGNRVQDNHSWLLKNAVTNGEELTNTDENSVYRNQKWMSYAIVLYRSSTTTWQEAFQNIRCNFNFYNEGDAPNTLTNATFQLYNVTTGGDALGLNPVSTVVLYIEFDYTSSNPAGTLPDGCWLKMIKTSANNNQENPFTNYDLSDADLTNNVPDNNIVTVLMTPTYTGSGDRFYTYVELATVPNPDDKWRFILITTDVADYSVRSVISEQFDTLNYDDVDMDFTGAIDFELNTVTSASSATELRGVIAGQELDTVMNWVAPMLNAQMQAKTGGAVQTALDALVGVRADVYYDAPLPNGIDTLHVDFYTPTMQKVGDELVNISAQRGQPAFIDESAGEVLSLRFPMTVLDNIYQQTNRGNYYQSRNNDNNWQVFQSASLNAVQTSVPCAPYVLNKLKDINFGSSTRQMIYVPTLLQLWVADFGNDRIVIYDAGTLTQVDTIALTAGDAPKGLLLLDDYNAVYVTCSATNTVKAIDIYSQAVTTVSGSFGTSTSPNAMVRANDEVYVAFNGTSEYWRIDVTTFSVTGTAITSLGGAPQFGIFIPSVNQVWFACYTADVDVIDASTYAVTAITTGALCVGIVQAKDDYVWVGGNGTIYEIQISTAVVANTIVSAGLNNQMFNDGNGNVYVEKATYLNQYDIAGRYLVNQYALGGVSGANALYVPQQNIIIAQQTLNIWRVFRTNDCTASLPPYSWVARTLYIKWQLEFNILGNTERYYFKQTLPNIVYKPDSTSTINIETQDPATGTWTGVTGNPCGKADKLRVKMQYPAPVTATQQVQVSLSPVQGANVYSATVLPAGKPPAIVPVESPYITDITTGSNYVQFVVLLSELPAIQNNSFITFTSFYLP